MRILAAAATSEVHAASVVVVPVGSIEQHGPHLPLDTDTVIAVAVASAVAEVVDGWLAPPLTYGSSGEHQSFAGTISIGGPVLKQTVIELVRSTRTWADAVLLVNAHGGNAQALTAAVNQLQHEGHDVAWAPCATEDVDLHAGVTETSLMLHLHPDSVRMDLAQRGNTQPLGELMPALVTRGVKAVSVNGVLGDPTGATAAIGKEVLKTMVEEVLRRHVDRVT